MASFPWSHLHSQILCAMANLDPISLFTSKPHHFFQLGPFFATPALQTSKLAAIYIRDQSAFIEQGKQLSKVLSA